jgi:Transglutaminase-like superfamily
MSRRSKSAVVLLFCASLLLALAVLNSAYYRHKLRRTIVKAEVTWARWKGNEPRLVSINGRVDASGLEVEALDSRSGWAALSDKEGNFVLPDLMWYPNASYEIVVSGDEKSGRLIKVTAPPQFPDGGRIQVGRLDLSKSLDVDLSNLPGLNSIAYTGYDSKNSDYYKELFVRLTSGKNSDEQKVGAINDYMATKFNPEETQWEMGSPRRILERGSQYCGHLSAAMETLLVTGNFRARQVYMIDGKDPLGSHVVVEVFYGGAWHLYDPMFGVKVKNKDGTVASYGEIRLDTSLISEELFSRVEAPVRPQLLALLIGIYDSGYHHFLQIKNKRDGS